MHSKIQSEVPVVILVLCSDTKRIFDSAKIDWYLFHKWRRKNRFICYQSRTYTEKKNHTKYIFPSSSVHAILYDVVKSSHRFSLSIETHRNCNESKYSLCEFFMCQVCLMEIHCNYFVYKILFTWLFFADWNQKLCFVRRCSSVQWSVISNKHSSMLSYVLLGYSITDFFFSKI